MPTLLPFFPSRNIDDPTCISSESLVSLGGGRIGFDTPNRLHYKAIYDAVGIRITSLPITAEKVRQALRVKQAMGAKEGSHA